MQHAWGAGRPAPAVLCCVGAGVCCVRCAPALPCQDPKGPDSVFRRGGACWRVFSTGLTYATFAPHARPAPVSSCRQIYNRVFFMNQSNVTGTFVARCGRHSSASAWV